MKLKTTTCDIEIEDILDRDGELEITLERAGCQDIIIYLNAEQARDLIVQIETAFANGGMGLCNNVIEG